MKKMLFVLCLLLAATAQQNVFAQSQTQAAVPASATTPPAPIPTADFDFAQVDRELDKITDKLKSGKISSGETGSYLQKLNDILDTANRTKIVYNDNLDSVRRKIDALGAAPEKGEKEPADIAARRQKFSSQADVYKAKIAQADLIKTKVDEINSLILKIRNRELLNQIMVKQSSIFHPKEFWLSLTKFAAFSFELIKSPLKWYQELSAPNKETVNNNIAAVVLAMLAALGAAIWLNLFIRKWFGYKSNIERPAYTQKVRAGLWMFAARGAIPAAIFGAFLIWLRSNSLINSSSFGLLLQTAAEYLLWYYLGKAVVKVTFTPFNSRWRIIEVNDAKAKSISSALIFSLAAICIVSFFLSLADRMNYDNAIIYSLKIFANAVKAFCVILIARRVLYDNDGGEEASENKNNDGVNHADADDGEVPELSTSSKISLFISFLMTAAFACSLFGYIRLSEYIINRFIVSAIVVVIFYILNKLLRVIYHQLLRLRFWTRTLRIRSRSLIKSEIWFGLLLTPVIWITAALALLAVWGVSVDILITKVKNFLVGFNIGGMHISITSIILGIISFFIVTWLFKLLKNSFISGNLSKLEMNDGVKNSVVSSISFLGFIVSALIAVAVMGGSLSSIAIIAGALSFGVGLGLQNMVSNLAAGMTILWERPIKIGDWVIINGQEGIVKRINMRSTELESWNKSMVIIPNSDILSKSLINKTYNGRMGRVEIPVSVSYNSDIKEVKKLLLKIAGDDPDVLATPAPSLQFTSLGDNSMNFQLNCYTANVYNGSGISFRVREKIIEMFREKSINIPFPQRVLYVEGKPAEAEEAEAGAEKNKAQASKN